MHLEDINYNEIKNKFKFVVLIGKYTNKQLKEIHNNLPDYKLQKLQWYRSGDYVDRFVTFVNAIIDNEIVEDLYECYLFDAEQVGVYFKNRNISDIFCNCITIELEERPKLVEKKKEKKQINNVD